MMELCETQQPEINDVPQPVSSHMNVKKVIGVLSSKGGVGKSTLTALLAVELSRAGFRVGILDVDLTCPSISLLFGAYGPVKTGQYSFLPLQTRSGIKLISPNMFVEDGTQPFIWKNALAGKVVEELFKEVEWGDLDYLLIDLPPAASEVTVEVLQSIPITGVVIVSQPQELSTRIVAKAVHLAQKMNVDIIGVVENKSYYLAPNFTEKQFLFGPSHIETLSAIANLPILARLPYDPNLSNLCDLGKIEDVLLYDGQGLLDAISTSLKKIELEKLAHPKATTVPTIKKPQEVSDVEKMDASSQQVTHTGEAFSDIVIRLIQNKENIGTFDHPDAEGYFLGSCGDSMQIHLQIVNDRILSARFLADGCGATIACGSMITKMACSKTIKEAEKITSEELITALDGLPEDHLHCAELAVMTLREAVIDAVEGHENIKRN
jgi:Mrp family chromosome partitioning ATPase/NifU-like protein involved in Fe-S cluster formation